MFKTSSRYISFPLLLALLFCAGCATTGGKGSGGVNAADQADKPYLILISIDGFRSDFQDLYPTPALDSLAAGGVRASALKPVFPTLTFPNHYSVATGLYPANHGLVANDFPDRETGEWFRYKDRSTVQDGKWYGGEPAWVTAEKQGMVTAAYYWVGTEADIQGIHPTHWYAYDKDVSGEQRVDQVLEWMAEPPATRPHLVTLYFEDVDDYSHWHGPGSEESIQAIERVDGYIGRLMEGLAELPHGKDVYIVLLSDHGQGEYVPRGHTLVLEQTLNMDGITVVEGGPYAFLYFDEPDAERASELVDLINYRWVCGNAALPENTPPSWQISDNPRFPDIFVLAGHGCAVMSNPDMRHKVTLGDHGWGPSMPEMRGFFIARGPRLPEGVLIDEISSVDVYPLLMSILELPIPGPIDGDPDLLPKLLESPKTR
jgi:predicted AlkP superfamily pyrophosphatase or phosphodiesterase